MIYDDNTACIAQVKGGYIKGDRTKHISLKIFFTQELQEKGDIDIHQVRSKVQPSRLIYEGSSNHSL